jgi:hypothetical protein
MSLWLFAVYMLEDLHTQVGELLILEAVLAFGDCADRIV